jgi:hypothetical protein
MKCKMAGAKARFVLQTLLARDPEGTPSRALVTKRFRLSFSPRCEVGPCYKARVGIRPFAAGETQPSFKTRKTNG